MNRDDVINKVFPHSLFGYDPVAVDAFLDEVIKEFDRLTNTVDVLQLKLSQELTEARQTNEILSMSLARAEYASRASLIPADENAALPASAPVLPEGAGPQKPSEEPTYRSNRKNNRHKRSHRNKGDQ